MSAVERETYVKELLKTNNSCQLPCWWGIIPGKSTWIETEQFLKHLGSTISSKTHPDGAVSHAPGGFDFGETSTFNRIELSELSGIVDLIKIHTEGYYDPPAFRTAWAHYAPEQIISTYGQPSRVWVESISTVNEGSPGPTMPYDLWLFYDDLGILLRYGGTVEYKPTYRICPTFADKVGTIRTLDMVLQSPDNKIPLETTSGDLKYGTFARPIEDVTNLTAEKFYKLFARSENSNCFETPRDVWP